MARTDHFRGVVRHCVMCASPLSLDRKADAITCSPACTRQRKQFLRSKLDQKECRYCHKPSTPESRVLFSMWNKWQRNGMEDEQFTAQVIETTRLVRENERLKRRLAELEAGRVAAKEGAKWTT